MRILRVVSRDYGAFAGNVEFRVAGRGLVLILGENRDEPRMNSNGSGKSTALESIDWCLFGVVPKGDHADSVINDEATTCEVTTFLEDDSGATAWVRRERPAFLTFAIDDQIQAGLDSKETQGLINKWLGVDRDVFHAAVFFGQNDLHHFADSTDARRMEILSAIIPELGEVDRLLDPAKRLRGRLDVELAGAKAALVGKEGEILALARLDYKDQIAVWEQGRQREIADIRRALAATAFHLSNIRISPEVVARCEQTYRRLQGVVFPPVQVSSQELDQARASRVTAGEFQAWGAAAVKQLSGEIRRLAAAKTGRCSQCGSLVSESHLELERTRLGDDLALASAELDRRVVIARQWQQKVEELEGELQRAGQAAQEQARAHAVELGQAQQNSIAAQAATLEFERVTGEVEACNKRLDLKQAEVNPVVAQAQQVEDRLVGLRASLAQQQQDVEGQVLGLRYAQFWVDAFRPQGLKSYILDFRLQEMNDAANEWVKLLTGGTFWIKFESQKKGRKTKTSKNAPSIRVYKYHPDGRVIERDYRGWCGGEKKRISWCIDFGLSRLVARRATKRWDLLILDEVFKHVDRAGGKAVVEMLTHLQQEKSSILVVEHDNEFQSHFESVITVVKERSRSRIVEGVVEENDRQESIGVGPDGAGSKFDAVRGQAKPKRKAPVKRLSADSGI